MEKCILEMPKENVIFSLQKLCLIKVSTILCNNHMLLRLILKCHFYEDACVILRIRKSKEWEAVQETAQKMISELTRSPLLRRSILEFLWPASYRIMSWKFTYAPCIINTFLQCFYWTDQGRINNIRTAKHMIKNKNIYIRRRFILTCKLCFSEEIHETWRKMSKKDKKSFTSKYHEDYQPLFTFWLYTIEPIVDDVVEDCMEYALKCAIQNKLLEAIKYLFGIMEKPEKYQTLKYEMALVCLLELQDRIQKYMFLEEEEIEIGYFLLSQIQFTDENREEINSICRVLALLLLLHSSEYETLPKALQKEIDFLNVDTMLHIIFNVYHSGIIQDNDYCTLFMNSWRAISNSAKTYVATNSDLGTICVSVLVKYDFPFLLKEDAFEKLEEFTSSDFKYCTSEPPFAFHQEKWQLLHFLIEERVVTILSLKNRLRAFMKSDKSAAKRVLRFLSKLNKNATSRSIE